MRKERRLTRIAEAGEKKKKELDAITHELMRVHIWRNPIIMLSSEENTY